MIADQKLENYLSNLEKALGPIPTSERAEIITEIKSHVMDAKERDPSVDVSSVLASLGEPETVANRYLMERGLKPGKAPRSPIIKWLTIGFLGTFGISALVFLILLWKFTPIIAVDDKAGTVKILGGVINISGTNNKILSDFEIAGDSVNKFKDQGEMPIDVKKTDMLEVVFTNGNFEVKSEGSSLNWECHYVGSGQKNSKRLNLQTLGKKLILDVKDYVGASCEISVPKALAVSLRGNNGRILTADIASPLDIHLDNGKVELGLDPQGEFKYDLAVTNGSVDSFSSSQAKNAIPIRVKLTNGNISAE